MSKAVILLNPRLVNFASYHQGLRESCGQVGLLPALDVGVLVVTNAAGDKAQSAVDAMGTLIVQRVMASP